jgi:hypothetical protein
MRNALDKFEDRISLPRLLQYRPGHRRQVKTKVVDHRLHSSSVLNNGTINVKANSLVDPCPTLRNNGGVTITYVFDVDEAGM